MIQTIAFSYFEIAQSRLTLMMMLRMHGVPTRWSIATNDYTYDWKRIRSINFWDDNEKHVLPMEGKMNRIEWVDEAIDWFYELAPERILQQFRDDRDYAYQLALAVHCDQRTPRQAVSDWLQYDEDYELALKEKPRN